MGRADPRVVDGFRLYVAHCHQLVCTYHFLGETLAFILIHSDKSGDKGAKERILTKFLEETRDLGNLKALFTLSDKDWSEIHAFQNAFPDAKHQLCLWHCARAVKKRLSILRRTPGPYNVEEAAKEFQTYKQIAALPVVAKALPQIRIRLNGQVQSVPVPKKLTIRLRPLASVLKDRTNTEVPMDAADLNDSSEPSRNAGLGDEVFLDNHSVDTAPCESNPDDQSGFDVEADWEFESYETRSNDATYVFCPAQHRRQIAEQIRTDSVFELYNFCRQRGLAESWAYMWNSWYHPKRWKLWARSSQPKYISPQPPSASFGSTDLVDDLPCPSRVFASSRHSRRWT